MKCTNVTVNLAMVGKMNDQRLARSRQRHRMPTPDMFHVFHSHRVGSVAALVNILHLEATDLAQQYTRAFRVDSSAGVCTVNRRLEASSLATRRIDGRMDR